VYPFTGVHHRAIMLYNPNRRNTMFEMIIDSFTTVILIAVVLLIPCVIALNSDENKKMNEYKELLMSKEKIEVQTTEEGKAFHEEAVKKLLKEGKRPLFMKEEKKKYYA
jgi:ribonuclease PH